MLFWTGNTIFGQIRSKSCICLFKMKFGTKSNLDMLSSVVTFIYPALDVKYPFCGAFGPINQNCPFKLKFATWISLKMLNSVVMFKSFLLERMYPFWANLVQKIKIVFLRLNLVPGLIWTCWIQWWSSFVFFFDFPFLGKLVQKFRIVRLRWNFVPKVIRISRIWSCCLVIVLRTRNEMGVKIIYLK